MEAGLYILIAIGFYVLLVGYINDDDFLKFVGFGGTGFLIFFTIPMVLMEFPKFCQECIDKSNLVVVKEINKSDQLAGKILEKKIIKGQDRKFSDDVINWAIQYSHDVGVLKGYGKYSEAIKKLERVGLIEEAAEIRRQSRIFKHIKLDVNELVDQINEYGSINSLVCESCGAPIDQKDIVEGKKFCNYCGGAFDLLTVNEVLRQLLNADSSGSKK